MADKRRTPARATYYNALKAAGVQFDKHYRNYDVHELKAAYDALVAQGAIQPLAEEPELPPEKPARPEPTVAFPTSERTPVQEQREHAEIEELTKQLSELKDIVLVLARNATAPQPERQGAAPVPPLPPVPSPGLDPQQHAGLTLNTHTQDEPIRTDEFGNVWYQNEALKPAYAKPRGRRVLRTVEADAVQETIQDGQYVETFEVSGDPSKGRPTEIKVTLPSYQPGIYKAPNMPFRIHTYNGVRGFDFDDINRYYGGMDLVPDTIKRCYVSSDLCYEIQSTVRAIENEYRERVLKTGAL